MSGPPGDEQQQPQWQQPQHDQPQWGGGGQEQWQRPAETPGSATAALILGICALVICGPICGPLAIVYGNRAKGEIDGSGGRLTGRGMASAGVIMGWIGTILSIIGILGFIAIIAAGA